METFAGILGIDPFEIWFFFEVLVGGLMAGVMYSLVALGFVLIFKASSVLDTRGNVSPDPPSIPQAFKLLWQPQLGS